MANAEGKYQQIARCSLIFGAKNDTGGGGCNAGATGLFAIGLAALAAWEKRG